jgi:hypothetical protein
MRVANCLYPLVFLFLVVGCTLPEVIQPMRLYDLRSGNTLEVLLHPTSRDHGTIHSSANQSTSFAGEYVLLDRYSTLVPNPWPLPKTEKYGSEESIPDNFAELYGFGKNSVAQPVGTGVMVGNDSTVVQIVFYRVSRDNLTGDGVAKDNKGRFYRVYFSVDGE